MEQQELKGIVLDIFQPTIIGFKESINSPINELVSQTKTLIAQIDETNRKIELSIGETNSLKENIELNNNQALSTERAYFEATRKFQDSLDMEKQNTIVLSKLFEQLTLLVNRSKSIEEKQAHLKEISDLKNLTLKLNTEVETLLNVVNKTNESQAKNNKAITEIHEKELRDLRSSIQIKQKNNFRYINILIPICLCLNTIMLGGILYLMIR